MLKEIKSDIYHLLHPKLAFFLTSISKDGKPNVMACAWATPVSEEPPIAIVCVSKEAHTAKLIKETKEFGISIPTKEFLKALWICGRSSGRDTDKFKMAKLKILAPRKIKPPMIEGCAGYLECRVKKIIEAGECYAFFGDVLSAYAEENYLHKGLWSERTEIPLHLGGNRIVYFR
ncbi:MAG: flavin reductase family protein [Thermodesulfovibrionales bacterium]|nr:flavin reductase family protein [Thermodesulfovibrionales bacterium]